MNGAGVTGARERAGAPSEVGGPGETPTVRGAGLGSPPSSGEACGGLGAELLRVRAPRSRGRGERGAALSRAVQCGGDAAAVTALTVLRAMVSWGTFRELLLPKQREADSASTTRAVCVCACARVCALTVFKGQVGSGGPCASAVCPRRSARSAGAASRCQREAGVCKGVEADFCGTSKPSIVVWWNLQEARSEEPPTKTQDFAASCPQC